MSAAAVAHPDQDVLDELRRALRRVDLTPHMPGTGTAITMSAGAVTFTAATHVGQYRWALDEDGFAARGTLDRVQGTVTVDLPFLPDEDDPYDETSLKDVVTDAFAQLDPHALATAEQTQAARAHHEAVVVLAMRVTDCLNTLDELDKAHQMVAATTTEDPAQRRLAQQLSRRGFTGTAADLLEATESALRGQR